MDTRVRSLSKDELDLLSKFQKMSPENKVQLLRLMKALLEEQREKEVE